MKLEFKSIIILFPLFFVSIFSISVAANIKTPVQAIELLQKVTQEFPSDVSVVAIYEKNKSDIIVQSAKILYDNARAQILEALSEIDNRIAYWQYQKDHPWNYFISKNPMKWITGPKQEQEIEEKLELLKSHQGELYVLLGQLSELGTSFARGYKDLFLLDYKKGLEWVDALLDTLIRIEVKDSISISDIAFLRRVERLQLKLDAVVLFKNELLKDISETVIPSYFEQNWLKSGAALFSVGYTYNNLYDQIKAAITHGQQKSLEYVVNPVTATLKDVFYLGQGNDTIKKDILSQTREEALNIAKNFVRNAGEKYGISPEDENQIIQSMEKDNYAPYQNFLDNIANQEHIAPSEKSEWKIKKAFQDVKSGAAQLANFPDFIQGKVHFYELFLFNFIAAQQRQYAALGKLVLLIPAVLTGGALYAAYQKLTEKNYNPLRRALVDINSLFVDPTKQLSDEEKGKMIYLVNMLKKRAIKELPVKKNVRADFIQDLERIESAEFSVAAKRAIIEDMFKKYSFLGLIPKK